MNVKTNNGEYEIKSLYPPRRNTDVYSCDNNCPRCNIVCECGLSVYDIIDESVGA